MTYTEDKEFIFEFGVKNYKVFDEFHWFKINPLTIITGTNSSGKSTLVKLIELIRDNFKDSIPYELKLKEPIDKVLNFNSKSQKLELRFKFSGSVFIDLCYSLGTDFSESFELKNCTSLYLTKTQLTRNNKIIYSTLNEETFNFKELKDCIIQSLKKDIKLNEVLLDFFKDEAQINRSKEKLSKLRKAFEFRNQLCYLEHNDEALKGKIEYSVNDNFLKLEKKITEEVLEFFLAKDIKDNTYEKWLSPLKDQMLEYWLPTEGVNFLNVDLKIKLIEFQNRINSEVQNLFGDFNVKYTEFGKYFFDEFWKNKENSLQNELNKYQNIYRIMAQKSQYDNIFNIQKPENLLASSIKKYYEYQEDYFKQGSYFNEFKLKWLSMFEIGKELKVDVWQNSFAKLSIIDFEDNEIDVTNLGFGVGQIISLILIPFNFLEDTQKSYDDYDDRKSDYFFDISDFNGREPERKTIALEEPEINLHPNWQSLMMELIVDMNKTFGINFIIETHSEYMIRKLQYLVANKDIESKKCEVYYFKSQKNYKEDKNTLKKIFYDIGIRPDGITKNDFGTGFFDESTRWTINLLKLQNLN